MAVWLSASARPAAAQVGCDTLPNPVYLAATTDIRPTLARIAPTLGAAAAGADQMTIVYKSISSCLAIDYVLSDLELTGTAVVWLEDGTESSCDVPAATHVDLAASDVSVSTCTGSAPPPGFAEVGSFVQTFLFVVPPSSSQNAITAEEGYFIMKHGGAAGKTVPPWDNPEFIAIRTPAASTQLVIGLAIGVLGTEWSANLTNINNGSGDVVTKIAAENTTGNAEATLGILSSQRYDQERNRLKALAFRPFGSCLGAVFTDSTASSFDKQNVRDGHYPIWAHLQFLSAVDAGQVPLSANAAALLDLFSGVSTVPGIDVSRAVIEAGAVPRCAMQVTRDYDGGPLSAYAPERPCNCLFESITEGATTCPTCSGDGDCIAPATCNEGYCE